MSTTWRMLRRVLVAWALSAGAALWMAGRSRPVREAMAPEGRADGPPLPPGRLVPVPGRGEMFVRELPGPGGDAPPVVLLHGWMYPSDAHWFRSYDALAEDARVIAVDQRGHGRGLRSSDPFRLVDVADDVAALLQVLDATPAILVGYSMGGPVALLTKQRHPQVVAGLVLAATSATYRTRPLYRLLEYSRGVLQVGLRLLPRQLLDGLMAKQAAGQLPIQVTRMISEDTPPEVLDHLPWLVGEFTRGSPEDVAEAGRDMARFDGSALLAGIDVPVAVLRTTKDRLVPPDLQAALAEKLNAPTTDLELDHDCVISNAEVFVPALRAAVADVAARAR